MKSLTVLVCVASSVVNGFLPLSTSVAHRQQPIKHEQQLQCPITTSIRSTTVNGSGGTTVYKPVVRGKTTQQPKTPIFTEVCETTGITLTRFMNEVAMLNPELRELTTLFGAIDTACKAISNLVKRSQLPSSETLGLEGEVNIQGEDQKKLDVITNNLLKRALRFTGRLGVLASEEEDVPVDLVGRASNDRREILIEEGEKYVAVFDPLDGSSNVDAGIPTGTIIGIYEHDEACEVDPSCLADDCTEQEAACLASTLQPGTNLVAAAYCLYSSSTLFALTLGNGVYIFTLDENIGEFVLSKPDVKIPEESTIYSFNEANLDMWDKPMRDTVLAWRDGTSRTGKRFSSRYIGSMVGDVHRTLLYGKSDYIYIKNTFVSK